MQSIVNGQWPIFVFAFMFLVLPLSTIPGMFDFIFIVLGGFTCVIVGLLIASVIMSRLKATQANVPSAQKTGNGK
jgi:hypothetical protein